jgi:hypothetical protein
MLADQRYTDGPTLGKDERIGDDSLVKGLVSDEASSPEDVLVNRRKIKEKQHRGVRKIHY